MGAAGARGGGVSSRIQCVHKKPWPRWCADQVIRAREALPFAESARGRYTHRVRYVELHMLGGRFESHFAAGCWCGQTVLISKRKPGRLVEAPTDGYVVCATCEGRAIGSGQLGARVIAGREVMYQPQRSATA